MRNVKVCSGQAGKVSSVTFWLGGVLQCWVWQLGCGELWWVLLMCGTLRLGRFGDASWFELMYRVAGYGRYGDVSYGDVRLGMVMFGHVGSAGSVLFVQGRSVRACFVSVRLGR